MAGAVLTRTVAGPRPRHQRQPRAGVRLRRARAHPARRPRVRRDRSGLVVEVSGVGAGELPTDESHLVVRAFRAACDELGWSPAGLRVVAETPSRRAGGWAPRPRPSSPASSAPGRCAPTSRRVDRDAVLRLTTELEGHPDNVAACLLGGATLSWMDAGGRPRRPAGRRALRRAGACSSPTATLSTHVARGLLPDDRAARRRRATTPAAPRCWSTRSPASPTLLLDATEDRLHQRQRAAAMPGVARARRPAPREAALAAVVSGAGPSVLVLATGSGRPRRRSRDCRPRRGGRAPAGGRPRWGARCWSGRRGIVSVTRNTLVPTGVVQSVSCV